MKTNPDFVACLAGILRARRGKTGARNKDLAVALDTSPQTVSSWFTGHGPAIRADALLLLCWELGISPADAIFDAVVYMVAQLAAEATEKQEDANG